MNAVVSRLLCAATMLPLLDRDSLQKVDHLSCKDQMRTPGMQRGSPSTTTATTQESVVRRRVLGRSRPLPGSLCTAPTRSTPSLFFSVLVLRRRVRTSVRAADRDPLLGWSLLWPCFMRWVPGRKTKRRERHRAGSDLHQQYSVCVGMEELGFAACFWLVDALTTLFFPFQPFC